VSAGHFHNLPAVKDLTLNGSLRHTNVASFGGDTTYKLGLAWQIAPSFKVRLNQSTSFLSPALFELYLADQTSFLSQSRIDPCVLWGDALNAGTINQRIADNCAADGPAPDYPGGNITATIHSQGGYGRLKAETSRSKTAGFVWKQLAEFPDRSAVQPVPSRSDPERQHRHGRGRLHQYR